MALYLLNATLIWAFSLLAYELLFRNETVHHWNRAYLLLTLAMGLLLPLWTWHPGETLYDSPAASLTTTPAVQLSAVKTAVVQAATPTRGPFVISWWLVYGAGVVVALLWSLRDAARIVRLYRAGIKTRQDGWTLVETGRAHSPFSFFRWVFLPVDAAPVPEDLQLILQHERRHGSLLHSLDMLFVQLVRIAFWFHPLVYWYGRRLELVHEYQADAAACDDVQAYGHLLLVQATGAPLPFLVHSFNRSPLKNRIAMLVKHPSKAARLLRYAITVPLVAGCALFCSQLASAQKRTKAGNTVTRNGNTFQLSKPQTDRVVAEDGSSAAFTIEPSPKTMNGQKIYEVKELTTPSRYTGPAASASAQLLSTIQKPLSRLPDGPYTITIFSPVISPEGRLVFFDTRGVEYPGTPFDKNFDKVMDSLKKFRKPIDPDVKKDIDAAIDDALHQPFRFQAATRKGTAVTSYLEGDFDLQFEVRNGVARLKERQ